MSIRNLVEALKPPMAPALAFHGPWAPIETELGVRLPQDYKDYVAIYGAGVIFNHIRLYLPITGLGSHELLGEARYIQSVYTADVAGELPDPVWPEKGGVIAFGSTYAGDNLLWRTRGDPDAWPVIFCGRIGDPYEVYDMGMTDFLAGWVRGTLSPPDYDAPLAMDGCEPFLPAYAHARRWR